MGDDCSHAAPVVFSNKGYKNVRYLWLFELINSITAYL